MKKIVLTMIILIIFSTFSTLAMRPVRAITGTDLINTAKAFGSYGPDYQSPGSEPHPRWNATCDCNVDNRIDGYDLILAVKAYGSP